MLAQLRHTQPVKRLGVFLLVLAAVITLIGALDLHPGLDPLHFIQKLLDDLYANVGTELASVALAVLIIDSLHDRRSDENEREKLVLQMGSPDNAFAIEAVRMLAARDWLKHGTLKAAHLSHANLEGANLQQTMLFGVRLGLANLCRAKLNEANLECAYLQNAILAQADLRGADLSGANLNGADMSSAKLDANTVFSPETILPDLTYWTPNTDMRRFTDSRHPDFWQARGRAA
ncbi:MAG: pentapeptide repeat-containing protein [Anaerolineae bacterium]